MNFLATHPLRLQSVEDVRCDSVPGCDRAEEPQPRFLEGLSERGGIVFRVLLLLAFVVLLGLVYAARNPLLRRAGEFWVVSDELQPSDAIVILAPDNFRGDRAAKAAELYKQHWAPRIVLSDLQLRPYAGYGAMMERDLRTLGVPQHALVRMTHRAESTREEVAVISHFASEHGWKKLLIVTSNFHTRRARYICHRSFAAGTEVRVIAAPDFEYDPDTWWESRQGAKLFFHEAVGYLLAWWETRSPPAATPASADLPAQP